MKPGRINLKKLCIISGIILILLSLVSLILWQSTVYSNAVRIHEITGVLYDLIPEPSAAVPESRTNNVMPSLSVNGESFAAILEFPENGNSFPVGGQWVKNSAYPCVYSGSVYDGSIVIGSTNQKGQIAFAKDILVGDGINIIDMTGNLYAYKVYDIRYSGHADSASLESSEDDFTLFIKNVYSFEYIIVHCKASVK